ncbi:MAG: hypothetical protein K6G87_08475 [Butyrivibrio sp.]|uniref:hypothetical protein n=1 Tax=Butyrivibrio sp. TaxID=28121 RepID=UPI0025F79EBE|nr:hypothetical protein [Butyrivibrio sp.]MCR5771249.1 hypothetical protein [Butyrivibrio sp.]
MGFENVCKSLNYYFSNHKVYSILQPFALPATFVCGLLMVIESFPGVSLGLFSTILYVLFYFFFIMLLGSENFVIIAAAMGLRTAASLISELVDIFKYKFFSWPMLIYILVFGYFTYAAYMKSLKTSK